MNSQTLHQMVCEKRGEMSYSRMKKSLEKIVHTPMVSQAVEHKRIGIHRLGEIASSYTTRQLHLFAVWLEKNPTANKAEIELHISGGL